ncbi:MAG: hypothetical protein HC890_05695 [Chloroflexaceae bacterium]|nr:hypothetical protein [Chloroflexaceae bacterium]
MNLGRLSIYFGQGRSFLRMKRVPSSLCEIVAEIKAEEKISAELALQIESLLWQGNVTAVDLLALRELESLMAAGLIRQDAAAPLSIPKPQPGQCASPSILAIVAKIKAEKRISADLSLKIESLLWRRNLTVPEMAALAELESLLAVGSILPEPDTCLPGSLCRRRVPVPLTLGETIAQIKSQGRVCAELSEKLESFLWQGNLTPEDLAALADLAALIKSGVIRQDLRPRQPFQKTAQ